MKSTAETAEADKDSGLLSNPLSFIHSGYFRWEYSSLLYLGVVGGYWSLRSGDFTGSDVLYFYNADMGTQRWAQHGWGFAVRSI